MNNEGMEVRIRKIGAEDREMIEIRCHEVNEDIKEIVSFIKTRQGQLQGHIEDRQYTIPMADIYYIEAVDNRVFIYCREQVYETRQKLYELEECLNRRLFFRASKSTIIHLMKVKSLKPALNGRFSAMLQNGEEVIISRKYVPELKRLISGGGRDER